MVKRVAVMTAVVGIALALHGPVGAKGPSGSSEEGNAEDGTHVTCNHDVGLSHGGVNYGREDLGQWVFIGPAGAEYCSDDDEPLDGRIIVSTAGPYVSADGDEVNRSWGLHGCVQFPGAGDFIGCGPDGDSTA